MLEKIFKGDEIELRFNVAEFALDDQLRILRGVRYILTRCRRVSDFSARKLFSMQYTLPMEGKQVSK